MKKYFMHGLCLLLVTTIFISCSNKKTKEAKYIPKEAGTVVVADASLLSSKLDEGNISLDSLLKKVFTSDSSYKKVKPKFDSLKSCGINWRDKFYFFSSQQVLAGKGSLNFFSLLINITDSAALRSYIQHADKQISLVEKNEKKFSYFEFEDKVIVSWNKNTAIITFLNYNENPNKTFSLDSPVIKAQNKESISKIDELKKEVSRFYDLKESESIASVKVFTDMFNEKADGYMYRNTNSIINALSTMPFQLPKLEELLQNNYSISTFNFTNGKIVGKSKTYTNATLSALLKKYAGPTVNTSLLENFPSQNIDGFFLASFNPEIFNGILKELEVESLVNGFLEKNGFSANDVYKCLKGDIAVGVSDLSIGFGDKKKPFGKMIVTAPVGDKVSLNKVLDKVVEAGFLLKKGDVYTENNFSKTFGLFVRIDDKNLTIASDSLTYQQYFSKTQKANIAADVMSQIKGKSTAGYIDLQQVFGSFETTDNKEDTKESLTHLKATFKDVIMTSNNFNGTSLDGEYEIRLKDEKQNSLITLLKLIPNVTAPLKRTETVEDIKNLSFLKLIFLPTIR